MMMNHTAVSEKKIVSMKSKAETKLNCFFLVRETDEREKIGKLRIRLAAYFTNSNCAPDRAH